QGRDVEYPIGGVPLARAVRASFDARIPVPGNDLELRQHPPLAQERDELESGHRLRPEGTRRNFERRRIDLLAGRRVPVRSSWCIGTMPSTPACKNAS
ncbi:MAG: hypothetical protein LH479_01315, partial [Polaromonas sp.]|nr:hypothetical protein [Polaromonas sp.]